ncbi:MAG: molecular chaperone DnaJ [Patescibacteria group bacterium]|nr:molecular chaperone DnaJ [Patescibacteria group bacterium]
MPEDYYKILGVSREASQPEIKKAFRRLAHKHHPDKGGDDKQFHKINEAYQVLSDKQKKSQYDQFGSTFDNMGQGGPGGGFAGFDFGSFGQRAQAGGAGFNFENLGDIFEEFFSKEKQQRKEDLRRGNDIQLDIEIKLEDVLQPQKREFSIYKYETCSRCKGSGAEPGVKIKECSTCRGEGHVQQIRKTIFGTMTQNTVCPTCHGEGSLPEKLCNVCGGEGRVKNNEKINIVIPAGVDSGQVIKFREKGDVGKRNGAPGDLFVRIFVKQHSVFQRKGDDLYTTIPVTFSQIALGDQVEIPNLEIGKKAYLKIPAATEPGKIFRISQKGVPRFSSYGRGNLYVEIIVDSPKRLTRKQKDLLKKLKEQGL